MKSMALREKADDRSRIYGIRLMRIGKLHRRRADQQRAKQGNVMHHQLWNKREISPSDHARAHSITSFRWKDRRRPDYCICKSRWGWSRKKNVIMRKLCRYRAERDDGAKLR